MAKEEKQQQKKHRPAPDGGRDESAKARESGAERRAGGPEGGDGDEAPLTAGLAAEGTWGQVWQVPVLILGLVLLGAGVVLSLPRKPKPNWAAELARVEQLLEGQRVKEAREVLAAVGAGIKGTQDKELKGKYHLLEGDLAYLEGAAMGGHSRQAQESVREAYTAAQEAGQKLDDVHVRRWAEALTGLGEEEAALAKLKELSAQAGEARYRIIRQILERRAERPGPEAEQELAGLLREFGQAVSGLAGPQRREQEVWATALKAKLMLAGNGAQRAIDFLLQKMQMVGGQGGDDDLAGLMVPLAQAYWAVGEVESAQRWFEAAGRRLADDPTNVLRGQVLVGLGTIALKARGDARAALEYFAQGAEGFAGTECFAAALVGQGDALAQLGAEAEAKEKLAEAVKYLRLTGSRSPEAWGQDAGGKMLIEVVQRHYEAAFGEGRYGAALEYAMLLKALYEPDLPRPVLEKLAVCHQRLAQEKQKEAQALMAAQDAADEARAEEARAANQQTSRYYEQAGDDFHRLAQMAEAENDGQAMGDALWQSAVCYDEAQCWEKAIARYGDYIQLRPQDPRREAAMRHLGLAYQASGQHEAAKAQFERLIEQGGNSPQTYDSLVPLAQCYAALGDTESAKRTLRGVLQNHPAIRPDSAQYRAALIELGKLHYRLGEFDAAIGLLTQAVERYGHGDDPRIAAVRFWLADALRQSAGQMSSGEVEGLSAARAAEVQQERRQRLEEAQKLYSQVITELEARPSLGLSELERLYYRNAYFYRADCAYDLGRYQQAIELYDVAARRWERDAASLVALVQIVNAYGELGMVQEAKAANRRAQDQQKRIPEEAFNDPNLPMSRRHWEEWLKWTEELKLFEPLGTEGAAQAQAQASGE